MNESEARTTLLIRSAELADEGGSLLRAEDRAFATETAQHAQNRHPPNRGNHTVSGAEDFLLRRALLLQERLLQRQPLLAEVARFTVWPSWISWVLPLAGLILGLGASELTSDRRIDLIAFPVAGMLVWNLAVYLWLAVQFVYWRQSSVGHRWADRLLRHVGQAGKRVLPPDRESVAEQISVHFVAEWARLAKPLHAHRLHAVLHLAAALFAAGIVGGMYLSALALEYRAGWESTFLTEGGLHRILIFVLGPASALTGIGIPAPEELRLLRWGAGQSGESGARWIHLYAVTASLFIVLPRLALAAVHGYHARSLRQRFSLDLDRDPYFRKLLSRLGGSAAVVEVIPYSYHLSDAVRQALDVANQAAFGEKTRTVVQPGVAYGGEDDFLDVRIKTGTVSEQLPDQFLILFNLAATPETETHGALADGMRRFLRERGGEGRLAIVVDVSPYRRKAMEQGGEERLATRKTAWVAMLYGVGLRAAFVDLERDASEDVARAIDAARMDSGAGMAAREVMPS